MLDAMQLARHNEGMETKTHTIGTTLPKEFGDGWMSTTAADYAKVAVWAGFDAHDLAVKLAKAAKPGHKINLTTVEKVLMEMKADDASV